MIRLCTNNHITGYRACPQCGSTSSPERVRATALVLRKGETIKHLRRIGKV